MTCLVRRCSGCVRRRTAFSPSMRLAGMERLMEFGLRCLFGSRIMDMLYDDLSLSREFRWSSGTAGSTWYQRYSIWFFFLLFLVAFLPLLVARLSMRLFFSFLPLDERTYTSCFLPTFFLCGSSLVFSGFILTDQPRYGLWLFYGCSSSLF
ncbi:hypothetical protein V8C44DRAFT_126226 [Trichoderma aethiopicum]